MAEDAARARIHARWLLAGWRTQEQIDNVCKPCGEAWAQGETGS